MRSHFTAALVSAALMAAPVLALAQPVNQGPIEHPKAGATNSDQLGRAPQPSSNTGLARTSTSPMGPSDNDPAHPETGPQPAQAR